MRALLQRVSSASVAVDSAIVGAIETGLLVLVGVGAEDGEQEAVLLADKTAHLRIFADEEGRFNHSLLDINGAALVVSQFTLYADTRKGRRPGFTTAAAPERAMALVEHYTLALQALGVPTASGRFGATMRVALVNEGPVTIFLDSDTFRQPRNG
ncbi:D-tyrosyl-tRNA(Tyr) deacylase [Candidatus Gracilibacteria bacterium]|nr:D-tyrosyl-tRNA(Tyr) deacylase [Candidatus Gracilibacteria bacterium]